MAKILFNIKFRPQIESREYKVITGDNRPVRIISWDKRIVGDCIEIVCLVPASQGDTETVQLYYPDGTSVVPERRSNEFNLFIVIPEPELTESKEDERVRKKPKFAECELEDAFKNYTNAGITISCGDMIASPAGKPLFKKGDWVVYDGVLGHGILQVKDIKAGRYTFVDNESTLLAADSDKYLRPLTPKDLIKSVEWSEEDKRALNDAIVALSMYAHGEIPYLLPSELLKVVERLKSLRSRPMISDNWKPSEEQMEVLFNAEGLVRANNYPENAKILAALYEQLKKLM